jgi:iron complex outermembrane recepter protein
MLLKRAKKHDDGILSGEPRRHVSVHWAARRAPARVLLLLAPFISLHALGSEVRHELQIEAQPISAALRALSAQTGLQVLLFSQDAAEKRSDVVRGYLTDDEALSAILDDSGLIYQKINDNTVVIRQGSPRATIHTVAYRIEDPQATATSGAGNAAPAATQSAAGDGALEEIVVTAQRREENINKVPISISAMSQAKIDTLGIKDFSDMAKYTPGVTIDSDRTNEISIRGIASTGGADTTGIYIDDIPMQTRSDIDVLPNAFDVERIEVLRGPQGTLFGAGSEGGAVRYITTPPSVTQSSIYSRDEVSYTQGGAPNEEVGIAGGTPIVDNVLGVRATVLLTHEGGWIDRVESELPSLPLVDSNSNRETNGMLRLAALWKPTDAWQVTPMFYYQSKNQHDQTLYWPALSDPGNDKYVSGTPTQNPFSDHWSLSSLKIQGDLGFATLISDTSYMNRETVGSVSFDGTLYNLAWFPILVGGPEPGGRWANPVFPLVTSTGIHLPPGFTYYAPAPENSTFKNWTQEIRLQSADPSASLLWTVGAFYETDSQIDAGGIYGFGDANFFQTLAGVSPYSVFGEHLLPNGLDWDEVTTNFTRQYAIFGDARYSFSDQWKLDIGLRESWIHFLFGSYEGAEELFGPAEYADGGQKQASFTPRGSLSFQMDPNNLYYFTYARGFRPGGANAPVSPVACAQDFANVGIKTTPLTYNDDTTDSFELGAKNNIDNRVQIASSIYYIIWNNIQQTALLPICGLSFIDNLGQAVAKGFDVQADFVATDSLNVNIALGYTDARYTKASSISPQAPQPIAEPGDAIEDATGNPVRPFRSTVGLEYRFMAFDHKAFFRADDQYTSRPKWNGTEEDSRTSLYDPDNFLLPSENEVNLRTGMTFGSFEIDAFVNNLTDSHPITYYNWTLNPGNGTSRLERADTLRPRTMGITFIFRK